MPPSKVNTSNIYSVCSHWAKIPQGRVKFNVGDPMKITKEKVKGYDKTFSIEIFRVAKVIQRVPQPVYDLTELQKSSYRMPVLQLRACQGHCFTPDGV